MILYMTCFRPYFVALMVGIALASVGSARMMAQGEDNPLAPRTEFERIGGEIGLTSVWQTGTFTAGCGTFEKGAKINLLLAAAYDRPLFSHVRFEALLGYQGRSVKGSYTSRELVAVTVDDKTQTEPSVERVNVDFENVGTASFNYIFLMPSLKFYITKGLYVGAGANIGLLLGGSVQYTKNILSKDIDIPRLGPTEVYFKEEESSDPYSMVFPSEDVANKSSLGFDGVAYVGAEFPVGRKLKIGPRVLYSIPLTPVITDPQLKLNTLQFMVGARYDLN
jgi:hypothetical protein